MKLNKNLLMLTILAAYSTAHGAIVTSNVTTYEWDLTDSVASPESGTATTPNSSAINLSSSYTVGSSKVSFQSIVNTLSGDSSISLTHQNNGVVPSYPEYINSIQSTLTQTLAFNAEAGDGTFSFAGAITATVSAGTPGLATATFQLFNETTSTYLIDEEVTSDPMSGSISSISGISLNKGDSYVATFQTVNDKTSDKTSDNPYGGSIDSGGTVTYNLSDGDWSYNANAVPEPTSLALLGLSALTLALRRTRA